MNINRNEMILDLLEEQLLTIKNTINTSDMFPEAGGPNLSLTKNLYLRKMVFGKVIRKIVHVPNDKNNNKFGARVQEEFPLNTEVIVAIGSGYYLEDKVFVVRGKYSLEPEANHYQLDALFFYDCRVAEHYEEEELAKIDVSDLKKVVKDIYQYITTI